MDETARRDPDVHILHADWYPLDSRWSHPLRNPFWRLYLNDAKGQEIEAAGQRIALLPDRCWLLPAWGNFRGQAYARVDHAYVHFEPMGAWRDGAEAPPRLARHLQRPLVLDSTAEQRASLRDMCHAWTGSFIQRLGLKAILLQVLARMYASLPGDAQAVLDEGRDDAVARLQRILDERYAESAPFAALAAEVGLSPAHLARRFRQRVGQTPDRYRQSRRIAHAADRLWHGQESIAAVAASSGFANRFHFTRVFTMHMGESPARWRRARR